MPIEERVLIAGAGPVGLVAAANLIRGGVPVTVFEAGPDLSEESRASTFHPPTLDMLAPHGITARMLKAGLRCPTWQVRLHPSGERDSGDDRLASGEMPGSFNLPYAGNTYSLPALDTGTEVDVLKGGDGSDRIFAGYGDQVDGGADSSASLNSVLL